MGGAVAQWVEHGIRRPSDAGSSPRYGKGFQSPVPVQSLSRRPPSPRVPWHPSTSVCTLRIRSIGIPTIVWTHRNTAHTRSHTVKIHLQERNGKTSRKTVKRRRKNKTKSLTLKKYISITIPVERKCLDKASSFKAIQ